MDPVLHRFEQAGKRYALDPETCFCFECDAISWDVIGYYPHTPANHILHQLRNRHSEKELEEVIGELEWLRASKSILTPRKHDEIPKLYELTPGIRHIVVYWASPQAPSPAKPGKRWLSTPRPAIEPAAEALKTLQAAAQLLIGRSETHKELRLDILNAEEVLDTAALHACCGEMVRMAGVAGKRLALRAWARIPDGVQGHAASVAVQVHGNTDIPGVFNRLRQQHGSLAKAAAMVKQSAEGMELSVILRPRHPDFRGAVEACEHAGFRVIELDLDGAYVEQPDLDPGAMMDGLHKTAVYYAERLLKHQYFRLEPIEDLFWRIYNGTPLRRADPAGLHALAVDEHGTVYPSRHFCGWPAFAMGPLHENGLNEAVLKKFEDVGSLTTQACLGCWARNLCGGGTAAVHQALSGSFRQPHAPWCEAQRRWMQNAVAAFSLLSSQGVNFTRVHGALGYQAKPSLVTMLRAAFQLNIGMRAIEEADAEWLTKWENWSEAAYFTFNESVLLLATKYDREMDSLHPRGFDQEFVLTRNTGEPMGLLKVRPERIPESALLWIYLHKEQDYSSESVRRSFRMLLREAAKQQAFRRLFAPAGPRELALAAFLTALGFEQAGVLREALYLHGRYQDVRLFSMVV